MSRDVLRGFAPTLIVLTLGAAGAGECRGQAVLDAGRHHLGTAGRPEWREFAGSEPEGRGLTLRFQGRANSAESTLLIRQRDVKLGWHVRLNDRLLGRLHPMEAALVHALAVPPGTLRDGENRLAIGPPPEADDVIIEGVALDDRPVREALGRATLEVRVTEPGRAGGLPCRITIVDDRGALVPLVVPPGSRLAARPGVVYTPDGRASVGLPPGRYTVWATRGFEYGVEMRRVDLVERGALRLDLALRREVSTDGLVACDTHVHTLTHSGHGDATLDERAVTLAGEGIELPIATDHDHLTTDLAEAARRMGVAAEFTPVVGDEVTTKTGHFNAFPFPAGAKPPDPGIGDWPGLLRAIRSAPGDRVVVLNHPRDLHAGFRPFAPELFNPVSGEHRRGPLGVDALEVINSGAMQSDPMRPVRDWMALRNRGERITAVGASDSHDVARYIVGQGRTYIACRDGDPAHLDADAACRALKAGRALVSLGLLARLSVDDRFGVGDLATGLGDKVRVAVDVSGPSWSVADRVELYANGVKVREERVAPAPGAWTTRVAWTLPLPRHDLSLVAVASGPGVTAPFWAIARPYQPTSTEWAPRSFGITNPIDLDGDGDGAWTSPRAHAEATIARVGTAPEALLPALRDCDEAIASQAAALCRAAGRDVRGAEFSRLLAASPEPVRRGFSAYAATLPRPPAGPTRADAAAPEPVAVEGQPLAANADRVIRALDALGAPLPAVDVEGLSGAIRARDAAAIQRALDRHVLLVVGINPEERVRSAAVRRRPTSSRAATRRP